jgi:hypothetical protein
MSNQYRDDGPCLNRCLPGKASTQPMSKCLHVASATRALSKSPSPRPMVTTCSSKRPTPDGCLTIPAGLYDNGKR